MITIKKRDGTVQTFDSAKIKNAIMKANREVDENERIDERSICEICEKIEKETVKLDGKMTVEDIQDIAEKELMKSGKYNLAKKYITYRYTRQLVRESNTTDQAIRELLEGNNEYWNTENSNKKASVVTTQRDYIAGITSTDIAERFILPKDVVEADKQGIIHVHDKDYLAQMALNNCCLVNLEDMLQNGTAINGVHIDKPHRFTTAMTIATQIITTVSSSQYGFPN